ncbi:MAG: hypothetical protein KBB55_02920 [Candidatus Buchananbacteria bacterium]|nr:hypothetical protein [Candidatus Buchananbacteria bacterium]
MSSLMQLRKELIMGIRVALVLGDGSAPEMMRQACRVVQAGAVRAGTSIEFVETPMGWNAHNLYGDTLPAQSLRRATEIGTLFFGGVGDPLLDNTIGKVHPDMKPEAKALLTIRKEWSLLLNLRPIIYYPELAALTRLRPDLIPPEGIEQIFVRFLLEDSYFGTSDLIVYIPSDVRKRIGLKLKSEVLGTEPMLSELSYYNGETVRQYFDAIFQLARQKNLPVICIDKSNIMPRYVYWRQIATEVGAKNPDVELRFQLVDSANALLFEPRALHGVIACGNEHGDILSDGAAAAMGSLGMMCSSAINPITGQAMFESGAGTAPTLAGTDRANPIGRILTGALMLRHLGLEQGATAIEKSVRAVLASGVRTGDIIVPGAEQTIVGTTAMAERILAQMSS